MTESERIKRVLDVISSNKNYDFTVDEAAVLAEYDDKGKNKSSLAIKVLSVFGGILGSLAFIGFLMILGIYESGMAMFVVGLLFVFAAILVSKKYERLIIDTFSVSIYILGVGLLIASLYSFDFHEDTIIVLTLLLSIITLLLVKNYILSFISILSLAVCLLLLIISNDAYGAIHVYIIFYALVLSFLFLNEGKCLVLSEKSAQLYGPLGIGLIFSFLFGLFSLGESRFIPLAENTVWISSVVIIGLILHLIQNVMVQLGETQKKRAYLILSLVFIALLPTIFAPGIAGSFLIILLSFKINYKTGFVIGILALVYSIGQYYYDLNFTLLVKSIILFSSGVVFLMLSFLFKKKFISR